MTDRSLPSGSRGRGYFVSNEGHSSPHGYVKYGMSTDTSVPSVFPPHGTIDLKSLVSENQSIKIIPSVEEIVRNNGVEFDAFLDNDTRLWLEHLKKKWAIWKKSDCICHSLYEYFEAVDDPFTATLRLVLNGLAIADCKPNTLTYQIVSELNIWSHPRMTKLQHLLTTNLRFTAFNIAKEQKNFSFIKLIVSTYHITDEKEKFLPDIMTMLDGYKYKAAQQSVIALNLQSMLSVEDLLVPLILQDKLNLVDDYLSTCTEQALTLVQYLDKLLARNESIKNKIDQFIFHRKIPDIKWGKLYYKPIGKLVARLCVTYNIQLSSCTNLNRHRAIGGIRFLLQQKYREFVISDSAWDDLVIDTVSATPELAEELVHLVNDYNTKEALKWAQYFDLPKHLYPSNVKSYFESREVIQSESQVIENWDAAPSTSQNIGYHELSLPSSNIIFVDTVDVFREVLTKELAGERLIGLDSEWKPSFGAKPSSVSLIQIATRTKVFLFDVIALNDIKYASLWSCLAVNIFENTDIIKMGFGLENDMREIRSSVQGLNSVKCKSLSYLELSTLWKALINAGVQMPYKKQSEREGLSSVAEQCFGLALKKHEQCSNWENRPLRPSQLEYAALDAFVLLEIYDVIEKCSSKYSINFDDICYQVMSDSAQSKVKRSRRKPKEKPFPKRLGPNPNPVSAKELKFVLDNNLENLAECLRTCNIDTIVCDDSKLLENCVKIANDQNRHIIVKNVKKNKTFNKIKPSNYIYLLYHSDLYEQLKEVCAYFNIHINITDIYGRCYNCNSNDFDEVSQEAIRQIKLSKKNFLLKNKSDHLQLTNLNRGNLRISDNNLDEDGFFSDVEKDSIPGPCVASRCVPQENIVIEKCLTRFGALIDVENVSDTVIDENSKFSICQMCGKCFWKGCCLPDTVQTVIKTVAGKIN